MGVWGGAEPKYSPRDYLVMAGIALAIVAGTSSLPVVERPPVEAEPA